MDIVTADKNHLGALTSIYNYYVRNTTVTFNLHELTKEQFDEAFYHNGKLSGTYTVLFDSEIIGFGCISPFNKKEAYDRSAYISIYLKEGFTGMGYGGKILAFLEKTAFEKGIRSLIALLCKENASSAKLFTRNGYKHSGELKQAGEKFGRVLDVVYYQKNF